MSRTKRSEPTKPKFDTKPYERPGLTETDILEIKESFDIFDREHTGLINPSRTASHIQKSGMPLPPSGPSAKTSPSTRSSSTTTPRDPAASAFSNSSTF